jgi:hypothetical protein
MAGQTENGTTKSSQELVVQPDRDSVRRTAARMYGSGMKRSEIARAMVDYLVPNKEFADGLGRPLEQRLSQARRKLTTWEKDEKFRDLIYNNAVVKLDLATPDVLKGLTRKAKRGRVDATRLLLELTGRHNPKGEQAPPQIAVVINGMPRPSRMPGSVKVIDSRVSEESVEMVPEDEDI